MPVSHSETLMGTIVSSGETKPDRKRYGSDTKAGSWFHFKSRRQLPLKGSEPVLLPAYPGTDRG